MLTCQGAISHDVADYRSPVKMDGVLAEARAPAAPDTSGFASYLMGSARLVCRLAVLPVAMSTVKLELRQPSTCSAMSYVHSTEACRRTISQTGWVPMMLWALPPQVLVLSPHIAQWVLRGCTFACACGILPATLMLCLTVLLTWYTATFAIAAQMCKCFTQSAGDDHASRLDTTHPWSANARISAEVEHHSSKSIRSALRASMLHSSGSSQQVLPQSSPMVPWLTACLDSALQNSNSNLPPPEQMTRFPFHAARARGNFHVVSLAACDTPHWLHAMDLHLAVLFPPVNNPCMPMSSCPLAHMHKAPCLSAANTNPTNR